jgi:hypothetical protein
MTTPPPPGDSPPASRGLGFIPLRLVLLIADHKSPVAQVLRVYPAGDRRRTSIWNELNGVAQEHPGRCVALEGWGSDGWKRYLWRREGSPSPSAVEWLGNGPLQGEAAPHPGEEVYPVSHRLVLLTGDQASPLQQVLREYPAGGADPGQVGEDLNRLARDHPGQCLAAEWRGPGGWVRFLWCRR